MVRQYFRISEMKNSRLTKQVFSWDKAISEEFGFQTWYKEVKSIFKTHNMLAFLEGSNTKNVIDNFKQSIIVKQNVEIKAKCLLMPKLRTFNTFKDLVQSLFE